MSERIEVDDEAAWSSEDEVQGHRDEGNPRTSSEPEIPSGSGASKQSTRSISGTALEEFFEHGRRYCTEAYFMPNDGEEQTRLAIDHQAFLPILDGHLTLGSIPRNAERILDIGTGTGDWAVAVAERFPKAEIIATDITTAFQPTSAPPNVFFELDDAQEEWTYVEPFDFIHMRALAGSFTDWNATYTEVCKHLKPGGTLEVVDRGTIQLTEEPPNSYTSIFNAAFQSAAERAGTPVGLDHLKGAILDKAGLKVIKSKTFDVPLGTWSPDPHKKTVGKMALISALEGLEAMSLRLLTKRLDWTEGDVRDLCGRVKQEVMKPAARAYLPYHFVVARKLMI